MDKDSSWMQFGFNTSNSGENSSPQNINYRPPIANYHPQNPNFPPNNFPTHFPFFSEGSYPHSNPYNPSGAPPFYMYPNHYPHMPPPQYGFRPTNSTNSSRRPSTDGSETDRDTASPHSQRSSFSSQFSPTGLERINLADDFEAVDVEPTAPASQKQTYSDKENALLASCWVDISTDAVVGNDQKSEQMWVRIAAAYNKNLPKGAVARSHKTLKSHYYPLQQKVRQFNSCYNQEKNAWASGCSDADIIEKAKLQYKARYKGNFNHMLAWNVLKDCPKFADPEDEGRGSKKTKVSASGEYVISSNTEESAEEEARQARTRPIGRNAARRMSKGKGKASMSAGENVDDLYNKNVESLLEQNKKKLEMFEVLVTAKERKASAKEYEILMRDTSDMTEDQLRFHLHMVAKIQEKWGM